MDSVFSLIESQRKLSFSGSYLSPGHRSGYPCFNKREDEKQWPLRVLLGGLY